MSEKKYLH